MRKDIIARMAVLKKNGYAMTEEMFRIKAAEKGAAADAIQKEIDDFDRTMTDTKDIPIPYEKRLDGMTAPVKVDDPIAEPKPVDEPKPVEKKKFFDKKKKKKDED